MWWAFAIVVWTLLSLIASPLIGGALAGGRALQIRDARTFDFEARPLPQTRRLA
jgi:hypothetical protein